MSHLFFFTILEEIDTEESSVMENKGNRLIRPRIFKDKKVCHNYSMINTEAVIPTQ